MDQVAQNYLQTKLSNLKAEYQGIQTKYAELESDKKEHTLVINTLEKLPVDRKCYRMVGGVLVERTVGEVLPAVKRNRDGLDEVLNNLEQQMQIKRQEINQFMDKYVEKPGQAKN